MKKIKPSKTTKKKFQESENVRKVSTPAFRCSPASLRELVINFRSKISEEHLNLMKKTQFWNFFKLFYDGKMKDEMLKKTTSSICYIINSYSTMDDGFKIGGKVLKLKAEDVAISFGMSMKGNPIHTSEKKHKEEWCSSRLYTKYFQGMPLLQRDTIENAIEFALTGKKSEKKYENEKKSRDEVEENVENNKEKEDAVEETMEEKREREGDAVKLIILHMLAFIFFPNKAGTCTMSMIDFVKSFERINSISWPCSIQEDLMNKIRKCEGKAPSVTGCVIQLLYFICEHAKLFDPEKGHENICPRAGKWSLQKVGWDLEANLQKLNDDQIFENMYKPLRKKEELLINAKDDDVENPMDEDSLDKDYCLTATIIEKYHIIKQKDKENGDLKEKLNRSEKEKAILLIENKQLKEEIKKLKDEKCAIDDTRQILDECGLEVGEKEEQNKEEEEKKIDSICRGAKGRMRIKKNLDSKFVPEPKNKKQKVDEKKVEPKVHQKKKMKAAVVGKEEETKKVVVALLALSCLKET